MDDSDSQASTVTGAACDAEQFEVDDCKQSNNPEWWLHVIKTDDVDALNKAMRRGGVPHWRDRFGRTFLHEAAKHGAATIINRLSTVNIDVDGQDQYGQTAIHEAVHFDQPEAIDALIRVGASVTIDNNCCLPALLFAVESNHFNCVKTLLGHQCVDVDTTDSSGSTALHYAAAKNLVEIAALLLRRGADHNIENKAGRKPVNAAAYAGSADVLQLLLNHLKEHDGSAKNFINQRDIDGNLLLHAAVDSGSLETVKVCLGSGAIIDCQQEDQSTPAHFAAMRGELQILRAMFESQPQRKSNALCLTDKNGMTLLHKAVLFDYVTVAKFLLDEDAQIEAVDINGQTPLLVATSKRSRKCIDLLLRRGANSSHVDRNGRNFVHLAVLNGVKLEVLMRPGNSNSSEQLVFDSRDYFGCTPLHYASIEGHVSLTDELLIYGASPEFHSPSKMTALHFASKYGRLNTCKKLLESSRGSYIINLADKNGWTALHFAARNGHTKVAQLLLESGAIFHRAYCGNSAFNMAAIGGNIKTMKLLLNISPHLLNLPCKAGNSALHQAGLHNHAHVVEFLLNEGAEVTLNADGATFFDLAVKQKNKHVCSAAVKHERWKEILSTISLTYPSPIFGLIEELPEVCLLVLEKCVTTTGKTSQCEEPAVTYDFTFLELVRPEDLGSLEHSNGALRKELRVSTATTEETMFTALPRENYPAEESLRVTNAVRFKEIRSGALPVVNHMLKFRRADLLVSPLCSEYLEMKWRSVAKIQSAILSLPHIPILIGLAFIIWQSPPLIQCYLQADRHCDSWKNATCVSMFSQNPNCSTPTSVRVWIALLFVLALAEIPSLLVFAMSMKFGILFDINCTGLLFVVASILIFTVPTFISPGMQINTGYQWSVLAVAAISEFALMVLFLRVNTEFGIYIVMFVEILRTLLQCSAVFAFFVSGYALALTVVYQVPIESPSDYETYAASLAYDNPIISVMRSIVMVTGELKFRESFFRYIANPAQRKGLPFPGTTGTLLFTFTVLVTIALYNLTVGLAIGDTKTIYQHATLKRIGRLCKYYTIVENYYYQGHWPSFCNNPRPKSVTIYPKAPLSRIGSMVPIGATPHSKTREFAIESIDRQTFQLSATNWMKKHKAQVKSIATVLDRLEELSKMVLDRMDVKWDSAVSCDDERRPSVHAKDFKSVKPVQVRRLRRLQRVFSDALSCKSHNMTIDEDISDSEEMSPRSKTSGAIGSRSAKSSGTQMQNNVFQP